MVPQKDRVFSGLCLDRGPYSLERSTVLFEQRSIYEQNTNFKLT
jgi:hypothetical protein